jgi:hypothetical protein
VKTLNHSWLALCLSLCGLLAVAFVARADVTNYNQTLRISEFLAVNSSNLPDGDGEFSDWIEIHNPTPAPVNLDGWYLTDDATNLVKWRFPATNLNAGAYLLVFASDKNRTNAGAQLHTYFKLSATGEYMGLVRPDGVTVASEYAPVYPPQAANISYGLTVSNGTLGVSAYYPTPTPERPTSRGVWSSCRGCLLPPRHRQ